MTSELIQQIDSLLHLDAKGVLSPHGIGGLARELLEKCKTELNTRAVPDVPELVALKKYTVISPFAPIGEYVLHSQAAEIIAADRAEIERLKSDRMYAVGVNDGYEAAEGGLTTIANHLDCEADIDSILHTVREIEADKDIYKERAEAAEAKLAQYKDQLPIGYITPKAQLSLLQEFSASDSISPVKMGECRVAIYDRPAPPADLKGQQHG